jgi:anti-sigma-K factor RskA
MTHEDYKDLLAAKALTALDAEDARELDTHLERCGECRTEIYEWEQTTAFIALDARAFEPSPQVRELILASVRAEGASKAASKAGRSDERAAASAASGVSRILPFEQPRRNVWTSLGSFGAIAATLLFVGLLVSLVALWQQNRSARAELARLSSQMDKTRDQLARERTLVALLTSPGARMTHLAGTNSAPGAHAMLAYDKSGRAMLMARGLPATPSGMAYQLWFIKEGKKMPGKVFTTDAAGNGSMEDQIPEFALGSAVFSITLEPARGVQVPTGETYLLSAL